MGAIKKLFIRYNFDHNFFVSNNNKKNIYVFIKEKMVQNL